MTQPSLNPPFSYNNNNAFLLVNVPFRPKFAKMFPYFSPAIAQISASLAQQRPSFVCADLCIYFFAGVAFSCTWTFLACTSAVEGLRIWSRNRPYPTVRNSEVIIDVNRVSRDTFENHFFSSLSREPGACAFKNHSGMHSARSSTRMADGKVEFRRRVDQIFSLLPGGRVFVPSVVSFWVLRRHGRYSARSLGIESVELDFAFSIIVAFSTVRSCANS
jgi:hypothetical protein